MSDSDNLQSRPIQRDLTSYFERMEKVQDNGLLKPKKVRQIFGAYCPKTNSINVPLQNIDGRICNALAFTAKGKSEYYNKANITGLFNLVGTKKIDDIVFAYITSTYKTAISVYEATLKPVIVTFKTGNLDPVMAAIRHKYPCVEFVIVASDDAHNNKSKLKKIAEDAAQKHSCCLVLPKLKSATKKTKTFRLLHEAEGIEIVKLQLKNAVFQKNGKLTSLNIAEVLALDIPPRGLILEPWLPTQGLAMLYAPRGIGKTFFALSVAHAAATGGCFLNWKAAKPICVVYIDGEMPIITMQQRLEHIVKVSNLRMPDPNNLRLISAELQECGLNLATHEGQTILQPLLQDADLIIIDNISTLANSGRENDSDAWLPVQQWALEQRRNGRSVLFVHHSAKSGAQRGTSKREDVLDTVIALKRPKDYEPTQGARFEVHFEKGRELLGKDAMPFESMLTTEGWQIKPLGSEGATKEQTAKIASLKAEGKSQRAIAKEMGVSAATINRKLRDDAAKGEE